VQGKEAKQGHTRQSPPAQLAAIAGISPQGA